MTEQPVTPTAPPETGVSPEVVAAQTDQPTGTGLSEEQVQQLIDQALDRQAAQFREQQAAATRDITGAIPLPEHAGGIGQKIAETWSLFEQQLAQAGKHPDQQ